jgi:hypothetical protein
MKKIALLISLSLLSVSASASRFWTNDLVDWKLYLNNGVVYVQSTAFPEECTYDRAQIKLSSDEYVKALWTYILAASKTNEKLTVVLDHDRNLGPDTVTCVILSAQATKQ